MELLALSAIEEEKYAQGFPSFGPERRGAPVAAFTRIDDKPIDLKCQIYEPDAVIVLDPTLMDVVDVTSGLKAGGPIIINSKKDPKEFNLKVGKVYTVDASTIAVENRLGSKTNPIVNTAILGAFSKIVGNVSMKALLEAIEDNAPVKSEENKKAAQQAHELVKGV